MTRRHHGGTPGTLPATVPFPKQASTWLTPSEAQQHLRCSCDQLCGLIASEAIRLHRTQADVLLFRLEELDAVPLALPVEEAIRALAKTSNTSGETSMDSFAPDAPGAALVPLKEAVEPLGLAYRRLLKMAHQGIIAVVNLNEGGQRARYVVNLEQVRRQLSERAVRQSARRSAPTIVDLHTIAAQGIGGRS